MNLKQVQNLEPDEKGIIEIIIDGRSRRFVKQKLINGLQANNDKITALLMTPKKPSYIIERAKVWKPTIRKNPVGAHKRRPVIAIMPDGKELPFASGAEAARVLGMDQSNIPNIIKGRYPHIKRIKFRYADQVSSNQLTA